MNVRRCLRQFVRPTGRRRARRVIEETVPLALLMHSTEAMANDVAYCPVERTERLHAFLRTGGRICWTCRTLTTGPTPPGGAE